jgi:hypothetical protein
VGIRRHKKGLIAEEDVSRGHGTFSRGTSTGGTQTLTKVGLHTFIPSVYSVLDFGATGDGVADDTAEIQAAIDQCESDGGGEVVFPPGEYLISSSLTVDNNRVKLKGFGRDSILRPSTAITPMIYMGADSGSLFPFSGNAVEGIHIDFDDTNSTGIIWRRWGQLAVNRDIHFSNPGATAVGIVCGSMFSESQTAVHEGIFEGINWWNSPWSEGGTNEGTCIYLNSNNCKIIGSTIIGAATAIRVAVDKSLSQLVLIGNRISRNGIGIEIERSGFGGYIAGNRFEENETWDIRCLLGSASFPWYNAVIDGNFFSQTAGLHLLYTNGWRFTNNQIKDCTTTTTGGRTTFIKDGTDGSETNSHVQFTAFGNAEFITNGNEETPLTSIMPVSMSATGYEGRFMDKIMISPQKGVDEPDQANALLYVTRNGEAHIAARDSTNNVENVFGSTSAGGNVGTKTAHALQLFTSNSVKQHISSSGQHFFSALGAAPADGDFDLNTREVTFWVNEAGNALTFKVKYADGTTFKSGTIALT